MLIYSSRDFGIENGPLQAVVLGCYNDKSFCRMPNMKAKFLDDGRKMYAFSSLFKVRILDLGLHHHSGF